MEKNGKGVEYSKNGEKDFEGEYLDGEKWNGKGKEYNENGVLEFEGEFSNAKMSKGKKYNKYCNLMFEGDFLMEIFGMENLKVIIFLVS